MVQLELFTSSWGVNSGFRRLADELHGLLPMQGRCSKPMSDNKHLEKFRKAQNAAYDFFNNGLCNKRGLFINIFGQDIDTWNIPTYRSFSGFTKVSWEQWENHIEKIMTPIIIAAAKEQGIK